MFKGSYRIIINCIGLLLSLLGYLKTFLTLGNFLPLVYITTLLQYSKSIPLYIEVAIKIPKEI
jgi:hypothetical protein